MAIRYTILGFFLSLCFMACATLYEPPKMVSRVYHACTDEETYPLSPVGKWCYSWCTNRKFFSGKCQEWKTDIKDFGDESIFYQLRAANASMVFGI